MMAPRRAAHAAGRTARALLLFGVAVLAMTEHGRLAQNVSWHVPLSPQR